MLSTKVVQGQWPLTGRILLTGACGQVGQELLPALRAAYGPESVIASDVRPPPPAVCESGPFVPLDVTEYTELASIVTSRRIDTIVHLAALLSATGEKNPQLALAVNNMGVTNVLEVARQFGLRIFSPSTIAVFGPSSPKDNTPDQTVMRPTTIYGVTKVHLELLGEYYHSKFGVDFRSLRYPGVISSGTMPGGGTTDYAVEIYHAAIDKGEYECFLEEDTVLPMMYMPDLLTATINLMEAPTERLTQRTYNIGAMSFTPAELAASIRKMIPTFRIRYKPDFRQRIADTWPKALDDSAARRDWHWSPQYDIDAMTTDMLEKLGTRRRERESAVEAERLAEEAKAAALKREELTKFLREADEPVKV